MRNPRMQRHNRDWRRNRMAEPHPLRIVQNTHPPQHIPRPLRDPKNKNDDGSKAEHNSYRVVYVTSKSFRCPVPPYSESYMKKTVTLGFSAVELVVVVVCDRPGDAGGWGLSAGTACVTETRPARSPRKRERRLKIIIWGSIYTKHYICGTLRVNWPAVITVASDQNRKLPSSGDASAVSVPYSLLFPCLSGITGYHLRSQAESITEERKGYTGRSHFMWMYPDMYFWKFTYEVILGLVSRTFMSIFKFHVSIAFRFVSSRTFYPISA
ncbi:hypothetical protein F5877DRAFT_70178 [Lentinula edodes]|nr:hypothetical protein F5877DRAFT_70178 [Lentinula edodes]